MRSKSKLSRDEYQVIFSKYNESGWSQSQIAVYLGRNKSTISRVLSGRGCPRPGTWSLMNSYEKGSYAYEKSRKLMSVGRRRLRLKTERIRNVVRYLLCRKYWSPEVISDFLKKHGLNISGKAIYNFIKKEQKSLKEYLTHIIHQTSTASGDCLILLALCTFFRPRCASAHCRPKKGTKHQ
jgi:IS30 family transposase